jgi:hypothetical protein
MGSLNNVPADPPRHLVPWQAPTSYGLYAPRSGYWQQPPPPFPNYLPARPKEKVGLDTVITALWGPERRSDRQWCFVRPHLTRRQQRSSSESTIDIPRPFPIPTGRHVSSDARTKKWAEETVPPPPRVPSPPPRSQSSASPPPQPEHEHVVKERKRHVILQYDGPASGDKRKRRMRQGGETRDMEDITVEVTYKHYCVRCGRPRSRRYHSRHPWGPGIKPDVGVCRRCDGTFFREPEELSPPTMSVLKEIIEETESMEEEVIIRRNEPINPMGELDGTSDKKSAQSRRHHKAAKPMLHRSESLDSLNTFAPSSEHGHHTRSGQKKPIVTRRLIYRYVPDEERTTSKPASARKTKIIIEERDVMSSRSDRSPEPKGARLLASRPGAWSRGKMIMVDEHLEESSESSSSSGGSETDNGPMSNREPEWYFRRYTRTQLPFPAERNRRPAGRPAIETRQDYVADLPRPIRRPLRGILQPSVTPRPTSRYRQEASDYDDDEKHTYFDKSSRVSFAPGTKRGGRITAEPCTTLPARAEAAEQREEEGLRDYYEAQADKRREQRIRNRVRHSAEEDGGPYMELDGHYSDGDGGWFRKIFR